MTVNVNLRISQCSAAGAYQVSLRVSVKAMTRVYLKLESSRGKSTPMESFFSRDTVSECNLKGSVFSRKGEYFLKFIPRLETNRYYNPGINYEIEVSN